MDARKINWCFNKKEGIKIVEPNDNLARDYLQSSEETLSVLQNLEGKSKIWLATTKYYCEYFAVYALLQKIGIKCEIHDCTIEVSRFLEEKGILPKGSFDLLDFDKQLRIDNQYYLKNRKVEIDIRKISEFILKIKDKINSITFDEVEEIRKDFSKLKIGSLNNDN